jgi:hypothetical protein
MSFTNGEEMCSSGLPRQLGQCAWRMMRGCMQREEMIRLLRLLDDTG